MRKIYFKKHWVIPRFLLPFVCLSGGNLCAVEEKPESVSTLFDSSFSDADDASFLDDFAADDGLDEDIDLENLDLNDLLMTSFDEDLGADPSADPATESPPLEKKCVKAISAADAGVVEVQPLPLQALAEANVAVLAPVALEALAEADIAVPATVALEALAQADIAVPALVAIDALAQADIAVPALVAIDALAQADIAVPAPVALEALAQVDVAAESPKPLIAEALVQTAPPEERLLVGHAESDFAPFPMEESELPVLVAMEEMDGDVGSVVVDIDYSEESLILLTGLAQGEIGDAIQDEQPASEQLVEASQEPTRILAQAAVSIPEAKPVNSVARGEGIFQPAMQPELRSRLYSGASCVPFLPLEGVGVAEAEIVDQCVAIATIPAVPLADRSPYRGDTMIALAHSTRASQQLPRPAMRSIPNPSIAVKSEDLSAPLIPQWLATSQNGTQHHPSATHTYTLVGAGSAVHQHGLIDSVLARNEDEDSLIADAHVVIPPTPPTPIQEPQATTTTEEVLIQQTETPVVVPVPNNPHVNPVSNPKRVEQGVQVLPDSSVNPVGLRRVAVPVPDAEGNPPIITTPIPTPIPTPVQTPTQVIQEPVPVQVVVPQSVSVETPSSAVQTPTPPTTPPTTTPSILPPPTPPTPTPSTAPIPVPPAEPIPAGTDGEPSSEGNAGAESDQEKAGDTSREAPKKQKPGFLINFNNVSVIEYIRFISKITSRNFIFNEEDLNFGVTIISEEPASIDDIMTALLQELRIHGLSLMEQGSNIIIHRNADVKSPAKVVLEGTSTSADESRGSDLITSVFRLNTLSAPQISAIVAPLLSSQAIVEATTDSGHLIVTDFKTNVVKIGELIKNLDSPMGGLEIGQYVVRNTGMDALLNITKKILLPIAQGKTLELVPHPPSSSIYVVSSPYLVEHTLAIMQHIDYNGSATGILTLDQLAKTTLDQQEAATTAAARLQQEAARLAGTSTGTPTEAAELRRQQLEGQLTGASGIIPGTLVPGAVIPISVPGAVVPIADGPSLIGSFPRWSPDLPVGHIENTQFYIHKLQYRKGDQIAGALRRISESLQLNPGSNADLITTINSIQWLEAANSLVMTGTPLALEKIRELIAEVDLPLRQVFVEMLILDTDIVDSLTYGVDVGSRFGGPTSAGSQAFLNSPSALPGALNTATLPTKFGGTGPLTLDPSVILPASTTGGVNGFGIGVIGRNIFHGNNSFSSMGALIHSLHIDSTIDILLNPKMLVEDNTAAEIFVGLNTPFQTQTIVNNFGNILSQNFEYRDIGTRFKVTPFLGNSDIITLLIEEEVSRIDLTAPVIPNAGPTTRKSYATTRVHIPNEYFLIMSGIIEDEEDLRVNQMPCLGGIPIIGAAVKNYQNNIHKRNTMIFLRPRIIDTEEEMDDITKRQQDIFIERSRHKNRWTEEINAGLDFVNLTCEER
jgi:type III secretion protein C